MISAHICSPIFYIPRLRNIKMIVKLPKATLYLESLLWSSLPESPPFHSWWPVEISPGTCSRNLSVRPETSQSLVLQDCYILQLSSLKAEYFNEESFWLMILKPRSAHWWSPRVCWECPQPQTSQTNWGREHPELTHTAGMKINLWYWYWYWYDIEIDFIDISILTSLMGERMTAWGTECW